jgi:ABC-type transporter Mla maintaining outer membrane lipid asymmetry ATPase subunit MlaF
MTSVSALRAHDVTTASCRGLSFDVAVGSVCKLIVPSRDRKNEIVALLTGLAPPRSGQVWVLGEDLYGLDPERRIAVFSRVGVVPEDGGLIGNLKVWENVLLPSMYHHGRTVTDVEPYVVALFQELYPTQHDLGSMMGKLPDQLTVLERRLVAVARAFLLEPELVIYDFLLAGLDRDAVARLITAAGRFQGARTDRTSVYLCADDSAYAKIAADQTIELEH